MAPRRLSFLSLSRAQLTKLTLVLSYPQSVKHLRPPLLAAAAAAGFDIVPVTPTLPLASQGPFDALLHKIRTPEWAAELAAYAAAHPPTRVFDAPTRVAALQSRATMLSPLQGPGWTFEPPAGTTGPPVVVGAPDQVVLQAGATPEGVRSALAAAAIAPPLLAKPLNAGARDGAGHRMALLMDEASAEALAAGTGLSGWSPPAVLQPYVPHSAPLFKVFVMGPLTMLARRPSLRVPPPAAAVTEAVGGALAIARVSAYVSEADTDAAGDGSNAAAAAADAADAATVAPDPPRWVLEALAARLRRELGLTLFNFDLIAVDTSRPRVGGCPVGASYLVIDINYFPGFEKLPDYEALMAEFLGWLFSEDGVATAGDDAAAEASARARAHAR